MASLKHVGRVKNTGRRCVVVFREMYNDKGHVVDENNCLVFESESLPDAEHQDLMRIVESEQSQNTGDLFNILNRARLGTGATALSWLAQTRRLRKYPTNNIEMTPDSRTVIGLDTINKIVKMQKEGRSQKDIENVLRDSNDAAPQNVEDVVASVNDTPVESSLQTDVPTVLDDAALAETYLAQAAVLDQQAKELRDQAKSLLPAKPVKRKLMPVKKSAIT
jgi:hypothetical protein